MKLLFNAPLKKQHPFIIFTKKYFQAQEGRTTLIVAHRLATIRDVDKILVFKDGEVIESGTHDELMNAHGVFHGMVQQQQ